VTRVDQAARLRSAVVPDWLTEVVRVRQVAVPWASMIRAGIAICAPLAVWIALDQRALGLLIAMGGLLGTVVDKGGPYSARVKRVASAAVFGGAVGLAIGSLIHDRGWTAVVALVVVAGVSALLSATGDVGSVTGLQLLIYASLGLGPLGAVVPWWHTALGFLLGTVWAIALTVPGWLISPRAAEQRSVAAVYHALAAKLDAVGAPGFTGSRRDVTAAFNAAYDTLLTARSASAGRDPRLMHLMALLNQANLVAEAAQALHQEGTRPPRSAVTTTERVADAIGNGRRLVISVADGGSSPGAVALADALDGVRRLIAGPIAPAATAPQRPLPLPARLRDRADALLDVAVGRFSAMFAVRLMASIGVAGVLSEVLPLQRSYWVVLTVAIVLKPDFGSVFARAVQRGIGTILGAVLGAVILAVVPYGPWLLIPLGLLAALLPYGQAINYGMLAVFLTPLVVVLIDLLSRAGWHLALDRLLDTMLGCAVVLLIGYAPWPNSWHAHLPAQFARAILDVRGYLDEALICPQADQPGSAASAALAAPARSGQATTLAPRSRLRRHAYRALSDLRAEFQRTMSEPPGVSRQATAWWPALVGLEEVMDMVTAAAVAIAGGSGAPSPEAVRRLSAVLGAVADAIEHDGYKGHGGGPGRPALPADERLRPVTEAVRSVLTVLAGEPAVLAAQNPDGG
jgi:uncharacterized membrane protein YccC